MRPITQFKTPWLPCDLLFRYGGQFDLGGWVGCYVLGWVGIGCVAAMRCVALRGAVLCCDRQSVKSRTLLIDRPIFLPPLRRLCCLCPCSLFSAWSPQLAIDAGSALDSTGLDSGVL